MRILVTGGAGYLGSVLVPKLVEHGHKVRVLDQAYFGKDHMKELASKIEFIQKDIRLIEKDVRFRDEILEGCQCVIHLAAISNDPSADLDSNLTEEINCRATEALAEASRKKRIKFLFSSSCALYGQNPSGSDLDETSPLHPLTTYSVSKVKAENALREMSDQNWSAVILRNGTLFGLSPRMRFDLVVNIFSMMSTRYNEIKIFGEGLQWRPFLHVEDAAGAFLFFAEKNPLSHTCYNIAHTNRRVIDLIEIFKKLNPHLKVTHLELKDKDERDYRVSTQRMQQEGFETQREIESGAKEISNAITSGLIQDPESVYYSNAKWMKELMLNGKLRVGKTVF